MKEALTPRRSMVMVHPKNGATRLALFLGRLKQGEKGEEYIQVKVGEGYYIPWVMENSPNHQNC